MSNKPEPKKFTWDDSSLVVDSCTVPFPERGKPVDDKTLRITFYELSRNDMFAFMQEATAADIFEEKEIDNPGFDPGEAESDTNPRRIKTSVRKPFTEVFDLKAPILYKYLAISCEKAKDEKWFEDQNFSYRMLGSLTDMLFNICHIDELQLSGGNPFVLPQIQEELRKTLETSLDQTSAE